MVSCQGQVSPSMYLRVGVGTLVCMCVCVRACFVEEKEVTGGATFNCTPLCLYVKFCILCNRVLVLSI